MSINPCLREREASRDCGGQSQEARIRSRVSESVDRAAGPEGFWPRQSQEVFGSGSPPWHRWHARWRSSSLAISAQEGSRPSARTNDGEHAEPRTILRRWPARQGPARAQIGGHRRAPVIGSMVRGSRRQLGSDQLRTKVHRGARSRASQSIDCINAISNLHVGLGSQVSIGLQPGQRAHDGQQKSRFRRWPANRQFRGSRGGLPVG